jgi:hypothetical protein
MRARARLLADEAERYRHGGWILPPFRLPPERVALRLDALETLLE